MSAERNPSEDTIVEELVAYLDGELDVEANRNVERRLSQDVAYRQRLRQLQQSWDLLDRLPRADVDESFTNSTLAMIAVRGVDEVRNLEQASYRRHRSLQAAIALAVALAFVAGFAGIRWHAGREDRQLLQDLQVIERVDEYRYAEDIHFLRLLQDEGLFAEGEMDDEL